MRYFGLILLFALVTSCSEKQRMEVVKFEALQDIMETNSEKVEVINFWATWCKPCIAEIPYFQKLHETNDEGACACHEQRFREGLFPIDLREKACRAHNGSSHQLRKEGDIERDPTGIVFNRNLAAIDIDQVRQGLEGEE